MKKEVIEAINTLKVFLGMEKQEEVVKLAEQMKLDNGTIIEVESLEAGASVTIVNEDERIHLPKGEYSLEDGKILVASEDGVLSEVKEMEAKEEEEKEMKEVEEEAPMMSEEPVKEAKKVVESTVKETYFEEIEKLKAENEELKAKITELSKVEEVKEEVVSESTQVNVEQVIEEETVELKNESSLAFIAGVVGVAVFTYDLEKSFPSMSVDASILSRNVIFLFAFLIALPLSMR